MRYFKRLSFGRATIYKEVAGVSYGTYGSCLLGCHECSGWARDHGRNVTWRFVWKHDGGRTDTDSKSFCSWSCRCQYYDVNRREIV